MQPPFGIVSEIQFESFIHMEDDKVGLPTNIAYRGDVQLNFCDEDATFPDLPIGPDEGFKQGIMLFIYSACLSNAVSDNKEPFPFDVHCGKCRWFGGGSCA